MRNGNGRAGEGPRGIAQARAARPARQGPHPHRPGQPGGHAQDLRRGGGGLLAGRGQLRRELLAVVPAGEEALRAVASSGGVQARPGGGGAPGPVEPVARGDDPRPQRTLPGRLPDAERPRPGRCSARPPDEHGQDDAGVGALRGPARSGPGRVARQGPRRQQGPRRAARRRPNGPGRPRERRRRRRRADGHDRRPGAGRQDAPRPQRHLPDGRLQRGASPGCIPAARRDANLGLHLPRPAGSPGGRARLGRAERMGPTRPGQAQPVRGRPAPAGRRTGHLPQARREGALRAGVGLLARPGWPGEGHAGARPWRRSPATRP